MKTILITGATGLIGQELGLKLFRLGYRLKIVTRNKKNALQQLAYPAEIIACDLNTAPLSKQNFQDVDCVIHLAGETVDGRWTDEKKKSILESRSLSTKNLLQNLPDTVQTVISASGQGIYGDQGGREIDENGTPGYGFLAEVCQAWEKPFQQLIEKAQARTVILRLGMVISGKGGALKKMIPIFQKNVGATLGSGDQWMSWIHIEDLCQVFINAVSSPNYRGVINVSSDCPVQNSVFTQKLCQHLEAFQGPRVPTFAVRLLFGEMADLVLDSTRVVPKKLKGNDFKFSYPTLDSAFEVELKEFKAGQGFLSAQQYVPCSIEKVFKFFSDAENLERLTPELLKFKIKDMSTEKIEEGTLITYSLKIHGVPVHWLTKIENWNPPYGFVDTQLKGPYTLWHHTHTFEKLGEGTLISDAVRYRVPMGFVGRVVAGPLVQNDVATIFGYRRQVIADQVF